MILILTIGSISPRMTWLMKRINDLIKCMNIIIVQPQVQAIVGRKGLRNGTRQKVMGSHTGFLQGIIFIADHSIPNFGSFIRPSQFPLTRIRTNTSSVHSLDQTIDGCPNDHT
jgi:hypothetical protein